MKRPTNPPPPSCPGPASKLASRNTNGHAGQGLYPREKVSPDGAPPKARMLLQIFNGGVLPLS